jgi:hypothetical protein
VTLAWAAWVRRSALVELDRPARLRVRCRSRWRVGRAAVAATGAAVLRAVPAVQESATGRQAGRPRLCRCKSLRLAPGWCGRRIDVVASPLGPLRRRSATPPRGGATLGARRASASARPCGAVSSGRLCCCCAYPGACIRPACPTPASSHRRRRGCQHCLLDAVRPRMGRDGCSPLRRRGAHKAPMTLGGLWTRSASRWTPRRVRMPHPT